MKTLKYITIAGLVTNGISIILDLVSLKFTDATFWKCLLMVWMGSNLMAQLRIEDLENDNKILSNHIHDLLSEFKKFRTHHNL